MSDLSKWINWGEVPPHILLYMRWKSLARSEALKKAQQKYYSKHKEEMKRNMYKSHAKHFVLDFYPTQEELLELKKLIEKKLGEM